jgi:gas vesicle protein
MADTPQHEQGKIETKSDLTSALPAVESPSISPAVTEPAAESVAEPPKSETVTTLPAQPASETVTAAPLPEVAPARLLSLPQLRLSARHKRHALLAASVAIAAALGAVVGAVASGGFAAPARSDLARLDETKAMQQSIARLSQEIASLTVNVEAANKSAHAQVGKIAEQLNRAAGEITGSISAPQTVTPLPVPRPAPRVAAVETQTPSRPRVVQDWAISGTRDGYVYVQGHGNIYQVSIGAPLPGLGAVEQVKRQDGRWMVLTAKGMIVSLRDRRYFEAF